MPLEKSLLDKFVNGAFLGKRKLGRPVKYNIRSKGFQGWVELVFNPRSKLEKYISNTMRFIHPYLFYITYRFHVEKAREAGKYHNLNISAFHGYCRLFKDLMLALMAARQLSRASLFQFQQ